MVREEAKLRKFAESHHQLFHSIWVPSASDSHDPAKSTITLPSILYVEKFIGTCPPEWQTNINASVQSTPAHKPRKKRSMHQEEAALSKAILRRPTGRRARKEVANFAGARLALGY